MDTNETGISRRDMLRNGVFVVGGLAFAGRATAQPDDEEPEEPPINVKNIPTINPASQGLLPVIVAFDPGVGTTPGLIESLVLGPLRAEPEHAARVKRYVRIKRDSDETDNAWKVIFDPKTAKTWFKPGDTMAFVQTTIDPIHRDEDPVKVVAGRKLPDLIPVDVSRSDTDMIVTVENQGTQDAGSSTTQVDFGTHGSSQRPTPALGPGASEQLTFDIPAGCFDPDCEFTIRADVNDDVAESNEGNNDLEGTFESPVVE